MVNQSIQHPNGINVFGSSLVRVDPDFATLDFAVTRLEQTARDAYEVARTAARNVKTYLLSAGVLDGDVRTAQVNLAQAYEHQGGQQRLVGYRAVVGFQVVVDDFERVE